MSRPLEGSRQGDAKHSSMGTEGVGSPAPVGGTTYKRKWRVGARRAAGRVVALSLLVNSGANVLQTEGAGVTGLLTCGGNRACPAISQTMLCGLSNVNWDPTTSPEYPWQWSAASISLGDLGDPPDPQARSGDTEAEVLLQGNCSEPFGPWLSLARGAASHSR